MIHYPNATPSARLEAALLRSEFSPQLQELLMNRTMWIEDARLHVWFTDEADRISVDACTIYNLLQKELPTVAPEVRAIAMVSWEATITASVMVRR